MLEHPEHVRPSRIDYAMAKDTPVKPNPEKDPSEWKTGKEPITGPQSSYLKTLANEAKEPVDTNLTKAEASEKIEELQKKTGRKGSKQQ